jgi:hypothetical protein
LYCDDSFGYSIHKNVALGFGTVEKTLDQLNQRAPRGGDYTPDEKA